MKKSGSDYVLTKGYSRKREEKKVSNITLLIIAFVITIIYFYFK